jgi:EmrB/QacA subfamily drug resistance transporter
MASVVVAKQDERAETKSRDRRWLGLAVIATAQLMIALDATVVNIALPSAQAALGFGDADRQWIVSAYTLALGGLLFVGGRLADSVSVGRGRSLLIGLLGFAAASAVCGAATGLGMLVAARALQGAFAALLAPTALSTLAVMFSAPEERARAFGIYGAIAASGGAIGLLLGGILTQYLDWRWCLFINVPIALGAAIAARAVLPDTRPLSRARTGAPFDGVGLALGSGGLVAVVFGCAQAATLGWSAPLVLALLGCGALALALFVRQEARSAAPLLPLHVVLDRQRGTAYVSALLAIAGMFGAFLFVTYLLQVVLGFTPFQAGLAFLPMTAASFLAGTIVAPRLLTRVSPTYLMTPGFLLAAGGMAVLTQLHATSDYLSGVLPAEVLLGLGIASIMMPASSLATSRVEPRLAGIASATLNSAQQIGASIGIAVLNTVAASATAAVLSTSTRTEALVHGYATAALCATALLLFGAAVAFFLPKRKR